MENIDPKVQAALDLNVARALYKDYQTKQEEIYQTLLKHWDYTDPQFWVFDYIANEYGVESDIVNKLVNKE